MTSGLLFSMPLETGYFKPEPAVARTRFARETFRKLVVDRVATVIYLRWIRLRKLRWPHSSLTRHNSASDCHRVFLLRTRAKRTYNIRKLKVKFRNQPAWCCWALA